MILSTSVSRLIRGRKGHRMAKRILEVNHVTKTYPGVVALNDVSFDVEEGEILALIGENGAGKSTVIKVISGGIEPDSGRLSLMNSLVESGKSILMISSEMEELLGMSDRIIVLHEGRVSGELQREEFNQDKVLELASGITED